LTKSFRKERKLEGAQEGVGEDRGEKDHRRRASHVGGKGGPGGFNFFHQPKATNRGHTPEGEKREGGGKSKRVESKNEP